LKKFWLVFWGVLVVVGFLLWFLNKAEPPKGPNFLFNILGEPERVLERPLAVASQGGRVFVADSAQGEIQVFDKWGKFLFRFPAASSSTSYPVGIALNEEGRIYVSDLRSRRLFVFSSDGKHLSDFPRDKKVLKRPSAITFANNKLYLTDVGDHRVKIFDAAGKLTLQFGQFGTGSGRFSYPNGIAVSQKGLIFVADSNNHRIQVFNQNGKLKKIFGRRILTLPRGVALDQFERVHVADTLGFRVFVFSTRGDFLFSYMPPRLKQSLPQGLAVDINSRRIYVTDRLNTWVSVWEY